MPAGDGWLQIPTDLLDTDKLTQQAEDWAAQQRQKLADLWGQQQQHVLNAIQSQWNDAASRVEAPATPQQQQEASPEGRQQYVNQYLQNMGYGLPEQVQGAANTLAGTSYAGIEAAGQAATGGAPRPFEQNLPSNPIEAAQELGRRWANREDISQLPPEQQGLLNQGLHTATDVLNPAYALTDPAMLAGGGLGKAAVGGAVAGGVVGAGISTIKGDTPEQTVQNMQTGANIGMLSGPAMEIAAPAVGRLAKAAGAAGKELVGPELGKAGEVLKAFNADQSGQLNLGGQAEEPGLVGPQGSGKPFYSQAAEYIKSKLPNRATAGQMLGSLTNPQSGIKPAELEWTGLKSFLLGKGNGTMTKEELVNYLKDNGVQVQEVVKGRTDAESASLRKSYDDAVAAIDNLDREFTNKYGNRWRQRATPEELSQFSQLLDNVETAYHNATDVLGSSPKYSSYTLPGGSNYRELLLTMPSKEEPYMAFTSQMTEKYGNNWPSQMNDEEKLTYNKVSQQRDQTTSYQSSHWEEPNILAHIRFNERTDAQGNRVLHIEEIQSDWAQQGRREGFGEGGVPSMPFKNTEQWTSLAAKRMIAWAAENGYDRITWTTGEQQAARYHLANSVDEIRWRKNPSDPNTYRLVGYKGDNVIFSESMPAEEIPHYLGEEPAKVIQDTVGKGQTEGSLQGEDLQVGGQGMRGYYDKILPSVFAQIGKKFGAKVENITLGAEKNAEGDLVGLADQVHSMTLPQGLKDTAQKGQALFSMASGSAAAIPQQPGESDEDYQRRRAIALGLTGAAMGHELVTSGAAGRLVEGARPLAEKAGEALKAFHENEQGSLNLQPEKVTSPDPTLNRYLEMVQAEPQTPQSADTRLQRAHDAFVRAWTNRGIDLDKMQNAVEKMHGLTPDQRMSEMRLLNPNPIAETNLRQNFAPAVQSVGNDLPYLSSYLMARHGIDQATAVSEKVAAKELANLVGKLPAKDQLQALNSRLRMYNRFIQQGDAIGDGTVRIHYEPLVQRTEKYIQQAQDRLTHQTGQAQVQATLRGQEAGATRNFPGGNVLQDHIHAIDALEQEVGPQRFQTIQTAADQVNQFNRNLLQKKVNAGIITQELADHLNQLYPHYVPTRILDYMREPPPGMANGRSLSLRDTGLKRLTEEGTDLAQEDPLASSIRLAYQTENAVLKNNTFNALVSLRNESPEMQATFREVQPGEHLPKYETSVVGFVNGKKITYAIPKDMADMIQMSVTSPIPQLNQAMTIIRGLLAANNPMFIPTHAAITVLPYLVRTSTREGGPQALPRVIAALAQGYWDAFDLAHFGKGLVTGRYGPDTERYLSAGGGMFGSLFSGTPASAKLKLEDLARPNVFTVRSAGDLRRLSTGLLTGKPFAEIINRVDVAPRVAAYNLALRRGADEVRAVTEGRTATIDFAQGGNYSRALNQVIPFFNVAMQGAAVPVRTWRDNPRAAVATAVATLAVPTVLAEAWNNADPQRAKDYADVPSYYKNTGLVFMWPGEAATDKKGNRKPPFVYIPTRELSPFVIGTREIVNHAMGRTQDYQSWQDLLGYSAQSLFPATDIHRLIPGGPIGDTAVAALTGKNPLTGGTVESKAADEEAGTVAKTVAQGINTARPAARVLGNNLNARPSDVQFALHETGGPGQIVGGIGRDVGQSSAIPLVKTATGQQLRNARNEMISPALQQVMDDTGTTAMNPVAKTLAHVPLTDLEQAELQRRDNVALDMLAQKLEALPKWKTLDQPTKKKVFDDYKNQLRRQVALKYLAEIIRTNGMDAVRQRIKAAQPAA